MKKAVFIIMVCSAVGSLSLIGKHFPSEEALFRKYVEVLVKITALISEPTIDEPLPRVAHAGGEFDANYGTSSIEALNANVEYFDYFELDFMLTADNKIICLHDWEQGQDLFKMDWHSAKPTLSDFEDAIETFAGFTNCTEKTLGVWLSKNPFKFIVTDAKGDNAKTLERIKEAFPEQQHRFIPQIYLPFEYDVAVDLGYEQIIWTLYRYPENADHVIYETLGMNLFAVTMDKGRAIDGLGKRLRDETQTRSYVHTINSADDAKGFFKVGIDEIYTDTLRN